MPRGLCGLGQQRDVSVIPGAAFASRKTGSPASVTMRSTRERCRRPSASCAVRAASATRAATSSGRRAGTKNSVRPCRVPGRVVVRAAVGDDLHRGQDEHLPGGLDDGHGHLRPRHVLLDDGRVAVGEGVHHGAGEVADVAHDGHAEGGATAAGLHDEREPRPVRRRARTGWAPGRGRWPAAARSRRAPAGPPPPRRTARSACPTPTGTRRPATRRRAATAAPGRRAGRRPPDRPCSTGQTTSGRSAASRGSSWASASSTVTSHPASRSASATRRPDRSDTSRSWGQATGQHRHRGSRAPASALTRAPARG